MYEKLGFFPDFESKLDLFFRYILFMGNDFTRMADKRFDL